MVVRESLPIIITPSNLNHTVLVDTVEKHRVLM